MELKLGSNKPKEKWLRISRKEKNLLLILGVAILFWVSYNFVFIPQLEKISKLKEEKTKYYAQLQKLETLTANEKAINEEWSSLRGEFAKASLKYYPNINQPELMHLLNSVIDAGKLKITSMTFKDPESVKLEGMDASFMGVNLPFMGSYKDLETFFSLLRDNPKRLLVNQISLFRDSGEYLSGQIGLSAYAYGNETDMKDGYYYTNAYTAIGKSNPFTPYDGYVESIAIPDMIDAYEGIENRTIINDMESDDIYFMSTSSEVTGKVSRIDKAKYGKTSIRAEYFISTGYQPERAYITLDDRNIILKYPPQSIGVWAYGYGYSPVTVGMRFQNMDARKIDLELTKGVNWTGWEYISASPPQDLNLYPLKLDRIYFELAPNRDDYGVMLFDRIESSYSNNNEINKEKASYIFYVVKPGDTLMSISESFYGTKSSYAKLAKDNALETNAVLEVGKILVIQK